MGYRNLGRSGLKVSPLCLGTMMLGRWGNTDEAACVRMVHRALDAGINFVDTSNNYGEGSSEEIVGPRTMEQLEDAIASLDVAVSDEDAARIDALVPPGTSAL